MIPGDAVPCAKQGALPCPHVTSPPLYSATARSIEGSFSKLSREATWLNYKNAGSIHAVDPRTVRMDTGAASLVEKLALAPSAPGPVLLYSAKVTWSVLRMTVVSICRSAEGRETY